jgi:hypothetical protein
MFLNSQKYKKEDMNLIYKNDFYNTLLHLGMKKIVLSPTHITRR